MGLIKANHSPDGNSKILPAAPPSDHPIRCAQELALLIYSLELELEKPE